MRCKHLIVGGGASGALAAIHLSASVAPESIVVLEPRAKVGLGIAYSTTRLEHRLNVRASNMSVFPQKPDDFCNWWGNCEPEEASRSGYAKRFMWGKYVNSHFRASGAQHTKAAAIGVDFGKDGAEVALNNGQTLECSNIILAVGHRPTIPLNLSVQGNREPLRYIEDVWSNWARPPDRDEPVVIIGSGLTAVDTFLTLRATGHQGFIRMVSRHALLPFPHADTLSSSIAFTMPGHLPNLAGYYRHFLKSRRGGISWEAWVDSLRSDSNVIWNRISERDRAQFERHLKHRWNVARHRIAPAAFELLSAEIKAGTLKVEKGSVTLIEEGPASVKLHVENGCGNDVVTCGAVLNCTGPSNSPSFGGDQFLESVFSAYKTKFDINCLHYTPDNVGIVGGLSKFSGVNVYALGPLLKDRLFETSAVPEIRQQAMRLALHLGNAS